MQPVTQPLAQIVQTAQPRIQPIQRQVLLTLQTVQAVMVRAPMLVVLTHRVVTGLVLTAAVPMRLGVTQVAVTPLAATPLPVRGRWVVRVPARQIA
jgi:hypothetical protein